MPINQSLRLEFTEEEVYTNTRVLGKSPTWGPRGP